MNVNVQYFYTEDEKIRFRCFTDLPEKDSDFVTFAGKKVFDTLRELNQKLNEYFASIDQPGIHIILYEHR